MVAGAGRRRDTAFPRACGSVMSCRGESPGSVGAGPAGGGLGDGAVERGPWAGVPRAVGAHGKGNQVDFKV